MIFSVFFVAFLLIAFMWYDVHQAFLADAVSPIMPVRVVVTYWLILHRHSLSSIYFLVGVYMR